MKVFAKVKYRYWWQLTLLAGGIHIEGISHVINYHLPEDLDDYVHRIGRTGRAGAEGVSISFACEDDSFLIPDLKEMVGDKLDTSYPPEELLS